MKGMKWICLSLLACFASGVSAQGVMLYKGGDYLYYSTSDVDSLVFVNEAPKTSIADGHRYVDLGLSSGTLWATCNVGASHPNDYGKYFAWGEFVEKPEYTPENYNYVTAYNTHDLYKKDDPAYLYLGGKWRTPTKKQIKELMEECQWSWERYLGTIGSRVTGPNGKSIFLPAGSFKDTHFFYKPDTAQYGSYWGRDFEYVESYPCATELTFGIMGLNNNEPGKFFKEFGVTGYGYCGRNIRPVYVDNEEFTSPVLSHTWSGTTYTAMAISYDSGIPYGTENEYSPYYNVIVDVPANDVAGKVWFETDYTPTDNSSSWQEVQAPIENWCTNWGDIYVRREFSFDSLLPERLFLACGHDDSPCEYYLNGELIWSANEGWNNSEVIELTPAQIALLKPREKNVLAFHVHQNWGGMYADCGLYTDNPQ